MLQWVMILSRVRARKGEMLWMCQGPRVSLCTVWHRFSLPGEVKIFSIPLNNFTSWRSRVQSIGQSVVLYSATSALRCPTGRFQHVTHICGPTMKESKLTAALGRAGIWQHEDCRCFCSGFPATYCQLMRDMTSPWAWAKLWDCAWN